MKTLNRSTLRNMINRGEIISGSSYAYDEMSGTTIGNGENPRPVRFMEDDGNKDYQKFYYIWRTDLTTKSGRAYYNADGTITVIVHSNLNYTFTRKVE